MSRYPQALTVSTLKRQSPERTTSLPLGAFVRQKGTPYTGSVIGYAVKTGSPVVKWHNGPWEPNTAAAPMKALEVLALPASFLLVEEVA